MVGLLDISDARDQRLAEPETWTAIEKALQAMIDLAASTDKENHIAQFGLRPPKVKKTSSEPALDTARIESFRSRLEILQNQRWEVKRGMYGMSVSHWILQDVEKFNNYLALIKAKVDFLTGLMAVEDKVNRAVRHDIRILGWHPVFGKTKAFADMTKLRLIKEASAHDYPSYLVAIQEALDSVDQEWKDAYEEAMEGRDGTSEIPGVAAYMIAQSQASPAPHTKPASKSSSPRPSSPGFFNMLRPKAWRKGSKDISHDIPEPVRSMSHTPVSATAPETFSLAPDTAQARSKSIAVPSTREMKDYMPAERRSEDNLLSKVETADSAVGTTVGPVTSMISRHDMFRDERLV